MGRTITEKIFDAHLVDEPYPGVQVIRLDAVFCHEITTPVAIDDLVARGKDRVFDSGRIKAVIDHVTPAKDTKTAVQGKILREWARRHRIRDFFDVGRNGVCHALFPELGFVRPGYTLVMGDSHTCTHGAFGAFAAGVGTTDLEVAILKGVAAFRRPPTIRVDLSGRLKPGVFAKDLVLHLISLLGTSGGTDAVVEFSGKGVASLSMEARMTVSNMVVEAGATCGIFPPDGTTAEYLARIRGGDASEVDLLVASYGQWQSDPDATYLRSLSIDMGDLCPVATHGYKPDLVKPVSEMEGTRVDQVYIGSCTNGRIEDLRAAAAALGGDRVHPDLRAILVPATPAVYRRALEEGLIDTFMRAGFCVTNPTCGACLGMSSGVLAPGEVCASTTNRNFNGRMGSGGMVHLMSPATAAATAIAGRISNSRLYGGR